jgi:hypothetical protein
VHALPRTTAAAAATISHICRFSASVVNIVGSLGLTWQPAFGIILVLYFYSHYFFASGERLVTFVLHDVAPAQ